MSKQHQPPAASETAADIGAGEMNLSAALAQIDRLQRENEVLRKGAAAPTGLSGERGKMRKYKVSLPHLRPKRSARCISPRHDARAEIREMLPVVYDDMSLFLNEAKHDPTRLDHAAWERFVKEGATIKEVGFDGAQRERMIDPTKDKRQFTIDPQNGPHSDFLVIEAPSPHDAWDLFSRFCGILSTIHKPTVELLPDEDEQSAARDVPQLAGV